MLAEDIDSWVRDQGSITHGLRGRISFILTLVFLTPKSYRNDVGEAQVDAASNRLIEPCSNSTSSWEIQHLINGTCNGLGELHYDIFLLKEGFNRQL